MKYILSLDEIEQMFCKEEGILAKFTDTSKLSIQQWLEEKGIENDENVIEFDDFLDYASKKGYNYLDIQDFYEYYQNLNTLQKNLEDLDEFIKENI